MLTLLVTVNSVKRVLYHCLLTLFVTVSPVNPVFHQGLASMIVPVYLSESAEAGIRGRLTVTNTLFLTGGQFVASLVCGALAQTQGGWRLVTAVLGADLGSGRDTDLGSGRDTDLGSGRYTDLGSTGR